ncbi:PhnD/SsuA/transferrin family substrate-binding protein [Spirochaeta cellobiosiphila]|uniref:PhnD/SsuA/transferrin family substrate-binding protein n=1 Tax=Spirochaeta cellobiosiphila TaxID=504483 RepID=UPI000402B638|nr:PhnD/SsuA/transferrin family substrate-binding protein [Spirochaeta cellobiosiphila]
MKKIVSILLVALSLTMGLYANGGQESSNDELVWVWYPNESTPEFAETRTELIRIVSEALGRPIKEQLTTDYAIAIEALVNENAAFSWFGGEGYVQAHAREKAVLPLVVNTGNSGTLSDAKYYSMLGTLLENTDQYKIGGDYNLDTLKQKKFSFVSNSSTSGFRVPSSIISKNFNVTADDLLEGGSDKVFAQVLFGGSHQGSLMNVLTGKADIGAFCNSCVNEYVSWEQGSYDDPQAGDILVVKDGADAPFDQEAGKKVRLIATVPVLNAPLVVNTNLVTPEEVAKVQQVLMSSEVYNNKLLFAPKGSDIKALFRAGQKFATVEDSWYDPIRKLSGMK